MRLEITNLTVSYDRIVAVDNISLVAESGKIIALLGPSGCGKTTLLRTIAGLVIPDRGQILLGGRDIVHMPIHERQVGMVFQDYALFTHINVEENIAFGLRMRGVPGDEWEERIDTILRMFHLEPFRTKRVTELSGGQQQRVALGRTLVTRPNILLLDEPLSALDRQLRERARMEIRRVVRASQVTTIIVTHDQEEALGLADHIVVMRQGRIEQCGTGIELYKQPASVFVAGFMGKVNVFDARIVSGFDGYGLKVENHPQILDVPITILRQSFNGSIPQACTFIARPESLEIIRETSQSPAPSGLKGIVQDATFLGQDWELLIELEGVRKPLLASARSLRDFTGGSMVSLRGERVVVTPQWNFVTLKVANELPTGEEI